MGNSQPVVSIKNDQVESASPEQLFNIQQNTFANIILLDIRSSTEYEKSHIDLAHHLHFVTKLQSDTNTSLHKQWLQKIIKLHQPSYSKAKITFYIIHALNKEHVYAPA